MNRRGFTLIELVMVIVIIGILASIAIPRFVDLTTQAKISATKGSLGAIRAASTIRYAQEATAGGSPSFPTLSGSNFTQGVIPMNQLNEQTNINYVTGTVASGSNASYGWWYITGTGTNAGALGAYADDDETVDTDNW